jgi:hypothetical protein
VKLFIATPVGRAFEDEAAGSFATLTAACAANQFPWCWARVTRDSNQARARNVLFHQFVGSNADVMLMIDSDMVFSPEHAFRLIHSLASNNLDVVCAAAKKRRVDSDWVGSPLEAEMKNPPLWEMKRIGFGMVALSRQCVEIMTKERKRLKRVFKLDDVPGHPNEGQEIAELVSQELGDGRWLAVDDVFSDRWRALGGRLFMNTDVRIGHVGTVVFT